MIGRAINYMPNETRENAVHTSEGGSEMLPGHAASEVAAPATPARIEDVLYRNQAILETIGFAAECFLQTDSLGGHLSSVLECLGAAAEVSHVYLFENRLVNGGALLMQQRCHWARDDTTPRERKMYPFPCSYHDSGLERWRETLHQGNPIYGSVARFPAHEQSILQAQGVCSTAIVPVFAGPHWWGGLRLDNCEQEHTWSIIEIDALRTTATIIGAAIQREQMRKTLHEEETRFHRLAEHAVDTIFRYRLTPPCGYEYINPSVTVMTGYTPEEYYADPDLDLELLHPQCKPFLDAYSPGHSSNITQEPLILPILHKDGHTVWIEQRYWLTFDETGKPTAMEGIGRDITERKEMEEELRRAREEAEVQLRRGEEFLTTTSHELRTPLHAIIGLANLLLETNLSPEQHDLLETMRISSDALLTVVNDTLDFSRLEAGKTRLEQRPFNVRECVEQSVALLAPRAKEKQIELTCLVDEAVPLMVRGDAGHLRQILVNLLSNAVKFTQQGRVAVWVECSNLIEEWQEPACHNLHIAVQDTGIGIAPHAIEHLFHPFSQVHPAPEGDCRGSGLGLSISKRLAEMMGGTIWVESVVDEGSTFHVNVALEAVEPARTPSSTFPHEALALVGAQFDPEMAHHYPLHILVAEDNPVNLKVMLHFLEHLGYRADIAMSGREVLRALEQQGYDLILMDVEMPEMDGISVTHHIRQKVAAEQQPWVVAITAHAMRGDHERLLRAGMNGYISKPVQVEALVKALREAYHMANCHQTEGQTSVAPIDITMFQKLTSGTEQEGLELATELITIYLNDTPARLEKMQQAIAASDVQALFQAAHTLKSNSAQLGATQLAKLGKELTTEIRTAGMEQMPARAAELVARMVAEYERVQAVFQGFLSSQNEHTGSEPWSAR